MTDYTRPSAFAGGLFSAYNNGRTENYTMEIVSSHFIDK